MESVFILNMQDGPDPLTTFSSFKVSKKKCLPQTPQPLPILPSGSGAEVAIDVCLLNVHGVKVSEVTF